MAETIELPVIPKPIASPEAPADPTNPTPKEMAHLFDEADQMSGGGNLMGTEPKKAAEPVPPAVTEPAKKDGVTAPAHPGEFELPPEITGVPAETKPTPKEPTVDEIMPEEPPASIKSEGERANWRKYRDHQKHLETELAEARKQLEAKLPLDSDQQAVIQQYEERIAQMSEALERAGLPMHPAFQEQFLKPIERAKESATQVLKDFGMEPSVLDRVFQSKGKERIEAMDDLGETITSPTVRIKVLAAIDEIERLEKNNAAAESDRQNWIEQQDQKIRAARHQQGQEQMKQIHSMVDLAVEGLRDKAGFTVLKKIEGNDKYNASVDAMIAGAKSLLTETTNPMELAANAVLGKLAGVYKQWAVSEQKRRLAAEKELAEVGGTLPSLDGNGGGAGAAVTEVEETDRMKKAFDSALDTKFAIV